MDLPEGTYKKRPFSFNHEESQIEASFQLALWNISTVTSLWSAYYGEGDNKARTALAAVHEAHDDFLDRVQTKRNTEAYFEHKGVRVLG